MVWVRKWDLGQVPKSLARPALWKASQAGSTRSAKDPKKEVKRLKNTERRKWLASSEWREEQWEGERSFRAIQVAEKDTGHSKGIGSHWKILRKNDMTEALKMVPRAAVWIKNLWGTGKETRSPVRRLLQ